MDASVREQQNARRPENVLSFAPPLQARPGPDLRLEELNAALQRKRPPIPTPRPTVTRASWDASALYAFQAALRRQPGPVCHSFKDRLKSMRSGEVSETQGRRSITRLLSGDPSLLEKFQHVVRPSAAAPVGDAVATVAWYDPENPTEELYAYETPAAAAAEFGLAEKAVFDCLEGRAKDADGVCFRWQTDWPLPAHAVATLRRGVYRLGTKGRFRAQLGERDGFLGNFDSEGAAALVCEAGRAAASRPPARDAPRLERDAAIPVIPPPEPASWAQCARCEKWRVLAPGTDLADLPEEWTCRDGGIKSCESVECSLTECATCECHTSNCEVVLVSPAGNVEMRYCSPRGAAAVHGLSRRRVHDACLEPDPDRRQNVFRYAHDLTTELRRRRRVGAGRTVPPPHPAEVNASLRRVHASSGLALRATRACWYAYAAQSRASEQAALVAVESLQVDEPARHQLVPAGYDAEAIKNYRVAYLEVMRTVQVQDRLARMHSDPLYNPSLSEKIRLGEPNELWSFVGYDPVAELELRGLEDLIRLYASVELNEAVASQAAATKLAIDIRTARLAYSDEGNFVMPGAIPLDLIEPAVRDHFGD
jgi:hypothetical protein